MQSVPPADIEGQEGSDRSDHDHDPVHLPAAAPRSDAGELREEKAAPEAAHGPQAVRPSKRRRTALSDEQKAWILEEHRRATGGAGRAKKHWYAQCLEGGIRAGILTDDNTSEGIRSYIRANCPA